MLGACSEVGGSNTVLYFSTFHADLKFEFCGVGPNDILEIYELYKL